MRTNFLHPFARTTLLSSTTVVLAGLFQPAAADCPQYITTYPSGRATSFYKPDFPDRPKDFAIYGTGGSYQLIYTRVDRNLPSTSEKDFGHAHSTDLKTWHPLPAINPDGGYTNGIPNHPAWSASHVWAPSVVYHNSLFYMFYTGVDVNGNQKIGLSTSTDLSKWSPYPTNPIFTCSAIPWSACPSTNAQLRDPFVMRDVVARDGSGTPGWLMYYTASPSSGQSAVGVAWASYNNLAAWNNLGGPSSNASKLFTGPKTESPHLLQHGSTWYLFLAGKDGAGNEMEGYVTAADPVATTWSTPTWFPTVLDTTVAAGRSQNWFASEHLTVGSTDYLFYVHDYDPDACDPLCMPAPTPVGPSTIETKTINWNPGFAVADLQFTGDGSSWTPECAVPSPVARWGASMMYDPVGDRIILHGGSHTNANGTGYVLYNDTWSYSLVTRSWSPLTTSGASPQTAGHSAMYDPLRQRMLVYGGSLGQIYALSLTGTPTWSPVATGPGAPANDFLKAAIDPVHDCLYTVNTSPAVKKLQLSTGVWSTVVTAGLGLIEEGTLVYDPTQNQLLFVGGAGWSYALLCDGPARYVSQFVEGLDLDNPQGWSSTPVPGQARYATTAVCDAAGNRLLVMGGVGWSDQCRCGTVCPTTRVDTEIPLNDVWSMNLTTGVWTQRIASNGAPPGRGHHAAAFDPTREEITIFGGGEYHDDARGLDCLGNCSAPPVYNYRNDTWTFRADGVPPATVSTLAATGQCATIQVTWLAPGDDGTTGTASLYDLRASQSPITPAIFDATPQIASFAPTGPAGTNESFLHQAGCGYPTFHYALKTRDNAGNWSAMSNVPSAATTCGCGGGGGGCPFVHVLTNDGWKTENSVLGRSLDGGFVQDAYRIKATPAAVDGVYRLQIREDELETTTLERLRLVIVDHDPALRVFEADGEVLLGRVTPAKRVTSGGRDVTATMGGGKESFRGKQGDAVLLEFPPSSVSADGGPTSWKRQLQQYLELEPFEKLSTRRNDLPLVRAGRSFDSFMLNQNGIRIDYQVSVDRWSTVAHRHPREFQDEMVVAVPASDRYRVTFVGEHGLASAGRLDAVQPAPVQEAVLLGAVHSRRGDVTAAVRAEDGRTTVLQQGEQIDLSFRAPEPGPGLVRDLFLMSEGVYTNAPTPEADGLPTDYALMQNRPNPFSDATQIAFSLPRAERVRIEVFDPAGRRVAVIAQRSYPAGHHTVQWDRRDTERALVKPGVYLYRLQAGRFEMRRRLVVLP